MKKITVIVMLFAFTVQNLCAFFLAPPMMKFKTFMLVKDPARFQDDEETRKYFVNVLHSETPDFVKGEAVEKCFQVYGDAECLGSLFSAYFQAQTDELRKIIVEAIKAIFDRMDDRDIILSYTENLLHNMKKELSIFTIQLKEGRSEGIREYIGKLDYLIAGLETGIVSISINLNLNNIREIMQSIIDHLQTIAAAFDNKKCASLQTLAATIAVVYAHMLIAQSRMQSDTLLTVQLFETGLKYGRENTVVRVLNMLCAEKSSSNIWEPFLKDLFYDKRERVRKEAIHTAGVLGLCFDDLFAMVYNRRGERERSGDDMKYAIRALGQFAKKKEGVIEALKKIICRRYRLSQIASMKGGDGIRQTKKRRSLYILYCDIINTLSNSTKPDFEEEEINESMFIEAVHALGNFSDPDNNSPESLKAANVIKKWFPKIRHDHGKIKAVEALASIGRTESWRYIEEIIRDKADHKYQDLFEKTNRIIKASLQCMIEKRKFRQNDDISVISKCLYSISDDVIIMAIEILEKIGSKQAADLLLHRLDRETNSWAVGIIESDLISANPIIVTRLLAALENIGTFAHAEGIKRLPGYDRIDRASLESARDKILLRQQSLIGEDRITATFDHLHLNSDAVDQST